MYLDLILSHSTLLSFPIFSCFFECYHIELISSCLSCNTNRVPVTVREVKTKPGILKFWFYVSWGLYGSYYNLKRIKLVLVISTSLLYYSETPL